LGIGYIGQSIGTSYWQHYKMYSYIKTLMLRKLAVKLTYYVLKGRKTEQVGILDWLSVSADIIGYRNI